MGTWKKEQRNIRIVTKLNKTQSSFIRWKQSKTQVRIGKQQIETMNLNLQKTKIEELLALIDPVKRKIYL